MDFFNFVVATENYGGGKRNPKELINLPVLLYEENQFREFG